MNAPITQLFVYLFLLAGSAFAEETSADLLGGWRTETVQTKDNLTVRQVTRILRKPNGRFAGLVNHVAAPGQKLPAELPAFALYYGTWKIDDDKLTTDIEWASNPRYGEKSPPLTVVSVDDRQSTFTSGPNTVFLTRHPWTLEEEIARTAELGGFAKDQGKFYQEQVDWKPVLGKDRETGVIVLDGDEMPSPNAVKGLSRNQNREAAARQKLRWLQRALAYLDTNDGNATPQRTAKEASLPPRNDPPPRDKAVGRLSNQSMLIGTWATHVSEPGFLGTITYRFNSDGTSHIDFASALGKDSKDSTWIMRDDVLIEGSANGPIQGRVTFNGDDLFTITIIDNGVASLRGTERTYRRIR